jgi:hypothetical protein
MAPAAVTVFAAVMVSAAVTVSAAGCGPKKPDPLLPPPDEAPHRGTFDPTSGCQRALTRVIDLTVQATGAGPTDKQRGEVVRRCVEANSPRASGCVIELERLPGRRGGAVDLNPVWRCLTRWRDRRAR